MRLLCTLSNEEEARYFSQFLEEHKIANNLEIEVNRDWGSSDYGTLQAKIWVIEEDQYQEAEDLFHTFQKNPSIPTLPKIVEPIAKYVVAENEEAKKYVEAKKTLVTAYLLIVCTLLFFIGEITAPKIPSFLPKLPLTPILSSPVKTSLLFDYPKTYELIHQFIQTFGIEALENTQTLPEDARQFLYEIENTPYWQGIYERFLHYWQNPEEKFFNAPLFEKIREGQVWRLFSPILLHGDLLHLLFNMIWVFVLGKQMEIRLGHLRFIYFILIAALITNTAQYLITGPNFLGISGVLCAMLTFIWMRQRKTPWEGYQLQRSSFIFILLFIFGMALLQLLALTLELYTGRSLAISIANTAHIVGLAIGVFLGKINTFARKI